MHGEVTVCIVWEGGRGERVGSESVGDHVGESAWGHLRANEE